MSSWPSTLLVTRTRPEPRSSKLRLLRRWYASMPAPSWHEWWRIRAAKAKRYEAQSSLCYAELVSVWLLRPVPVLGRLQGRVQRGHRPACLPRTGVQPLRLHTWATYNDDDGTGPTGLRFHETNEQSKMGWRYQQSLILDDWTIPDIMMLCEH